MAAVEVREATDDDARVIAEHMREVDRREVYSFAGLTPKAAVDFSLHMSSRAWTGLADGRIVVMFGVVPQSLVGSDTGSPWLLGTPLIEANAVAFLRRCRHYVAEIRSEYPQLENYVDVRNRVSIGWLRSLGFAIHPAAPAGPFGRPFHRFTMGL